MNGSFFKRSKGRYMTHIPSDEIVLAITDLSKGAYQLLMYYYSREDGWVFYDNSTMTDLSISKRVFQAHKKELKDKNYLIILKAEADTYIVGKQAVKKYRDMIKVAKLAVKVTAPTEPEDDYEDNKPDWLE